jgi:hypothetical protein
MSIKKKDKEFFTNDANSVLEVYLEYLNNNINEGIAMEVIGFIPLDIDFKLYIICNKEFRFVVCGTDAKKLCDKRFKNVYKLLKHSTFFAYPKDESLQIFNKFQYKNVASKICQDLNLNGDSDEFVWSKDVNDILNYLK